MTERDPEVPPEPILSLWSAKTKDVGAVWAVYRPIWVHEKRKWADFKNFKSRVAAQRYFDSLSAQKGAKVA